MEQDPSGPAYVVGAIIYVLALVNSKKHENIQQLVVRLVVAAIPAVITGFILYVALGGEVESPL